MDYNRDPPPPIFRELCIFCRRNGWGLFIGSDANAHSVLWGSPQTNARGEKLTDFIYSEDLHIHNIGNAPTFEDARRTAIIDITLTNNICLDKLENWKVSDDISGSDHYAIEFDIKLQVESLSTKYRNVRKTDWEGYRSDLKTNVQTIDLGLDIEELAETLEFAIIDAYHKNCRLKESFGSKKPTWWNNELEKMKKEVRKCVKRHKHRKNAENKELMNDAKFRYRKAQDRAREEGWKKLTSEMNSLTATAKMNKIMKMGKKQEIGTIKREDGTFTSTPRETLDLLLRTHFPNKENNNHLIADMEQENEAEIINDINLDIDELEASDDNINLDDDNSALNEILGEAGLEPITENNFDDLGQGVEQYLGEGDLNRHNNSFNIGGIDNFDIVKTVTKQSITAAFKSFKPFKSPGADGIFPCLVQKGIDIIDHIILILFK